LGWAFKAWRHGTWFEKMRNARNAVIYELDEARVNEVELCSNRDCSRSVPGITLLYKVFNSSQVFRESGSFGRACSRRASLERTTPSTARACLPSSTIHDVNWECSLSWRNIELSSLILSCLLAYDNVCNLPPSLTWIMLSVLTTLSQFQATLEILLLDDPVIQRLPLLVFQGPI
jgi:hypothetical protein